MSTTLTQQIGKAQQEADAAAARAMALQEALDTKRAEAADAAEERVKAWAQEVVDGHRETQRALLAQWHLAQQAVEDAIVADPQAVPRLWSAWAGVSGEIAAEHSDYLTAVGVLDPYAEVTAVAPVADLPGYSNLVDHLMRRLSEEHIAAAADRRQATLTAAMAVE